MSSCFPSFSNEKKYKPVVIIRMIIVCCIKNIEEGGNIMCCAVFNKWS